MREALEKALKAGERSPIGLVPRPVRSVSRAVPIPAGLAGYEVDAAQARFYDVLLLKGGHE